MYLGPTLLPISLAGLLCKGSSTALAVPHTMVSVVVPVFNGEKTIESCIQHIEDQSLRPFEIIVVDDCSTDATPVILGRLQEQYSNVTVIRNGENRGKAASVSSVLKLVCSPFTAIIDSDTYLDRDYLRNTLGALHSDETVAASGNVLPSEADSGISRSRLIEYLHSQSTYKKLQSSMGVSFVSPGCCSVWRTSWINENGIPAETVVEDMDITWEAQIDGKKLAYVPEAFAFTEEPKTFNNYVKQLSRWFSWRPVLEKHGNKLPAGLKLLVSWMLAESVGYLLWIGLIFYFLVSRNFFQALFILTGDILIITLVSLHQGMKIGLPWRRILTSIPYYYTLRIPTAIMFWKSFINPKRTGW